MISVLNNKTCPFCADPDLEILIPSKALPEDDVNVLRCRKCDLVFLDAQDHLHQFEAEEFEYWKNADQKKIYVEKEIQKSFIQEFNARLDALEKFYPQKGTLLDVGCGVGHFLAEAQKRGWKVKGLDISSGAKAAAKDLYGIDVEVGSLDGGLFHSERFDVITLWDVIEHIRKPLENLNYASQLLKEDGILVMKTPNEGGFFKQSALNLYRIFGMPASFLLKYVYYLPHYFSYSKKSMNYLLRSAGFEMIRFELDETPHEFAEGKINIHYRNDPKRAFVISMIPIANRISRLLRKGNKMIVYARKKTKGNNV